MTLYSLIIFYQHRHALLYKLVVNNERKYMASFRNFIGTRPICLRDWGKVQILLEALFFHFQSDAAYLTLIKT